jgi:fumarate reductase flavoprotein subunit
MIDVDPRAERATRDIVSRAIFAEMRAGHTTPHGGVYLSMAHLGAENVRRQFKGMVERCADCGFDLADKVEVVPTAHYLMGGVEFAADGTTELSGLFVAGEDAGGVHGANRLGGNGVANSTVFGGIAGTTMAGWVAREGEFRTPDAAALDAAVAGGEIFFAARGGTGDLESIRERLLAAMWDDAGIVRDAAGLARADTALAALSAEIEVYAPPAACRDRAFNLHWHDWLNLKSLVVVSRIIVCAARARENSRGAHYRADFPDPGDIARSTYTRVRLREGNLACDAVPVRFTRVRPGESLLAT